MVKDFIVQPATINRFELRKRITFEGPPGRIRGVILHSYQFSASSISRMLANMYLVCSLMMHFRLKHVSTAHKKTMDSVTIHATIKTRWFFFILTCEGRPCALASCDFRVYSSFCRAYI